jgi:hypothetical protein
MNFYSRVYYTLCAENVHNKVLYRKGSNLHKHHIVPKHNGGSEDEDNFTYLTIRNHIIAHFLLWKMHRMVNDLRSMKMLGADLSFSQRQAIGKWCHENKIGIHGYSIEQKREISLKGVKTQKENNMGFFNEELRKVWASEAGKISFKSPKSVFAYWTTKEGRSIRGKMGAAANTGKKSMYKPGDISFIRVKVEDINSFLEKGYIFGSPLKPMSGKKGSSHRRRPITDGTNTFISLKEAALFYGVTSASVCGWLKSRDNWKYI